MVESLTTELDAVNEILSSLGRRPVASLLAADMTPDATFAQARIQAVNKQVQLKGWHFNREWNVEFTPDGSDEVVLPSNVSRIDAARRIEVHHTDKDLVMREGKVYDKVENTYAFPELSTMHLDLVRLLGFEDSPEAVRYYVMVRAGRQVQDRLLSDPSLAQFSREDEFAALAALKEEEWRTANVNALNEANANRTVSRGEFGHGRWFTS